MSLQEIMYEIKKIKSFAEAEVSDSPRETLGGRLSRRRKAQEDLKDLTESYRRALLSSALFIIVVGSKREAFIKEAANYQAFGTDADTFFRDIANSLSPALWEKKETNSSLLEVIGRVLENKALDIGIIGYPMLTFKQEFLRFLNTKEDLVAFIKMVISTQVGTEVVGVQAAKSILKTAIDSAYAGNNTPILLSVSDENAVQELGKGLSRITKKVFLVTAGETERVYRDTYSLANISKKSVENTLRMIRAELNGQTLKLPLDEAQESTSAQLSAEVIEDAALKAARDFGIGTHVEKIELSDEDMDTFVKTLENPPEPTPALVEAFKKHSKKSTKSKTKKVTGEPSLPATTGDVTVATGTVDTETLEES